MTEAALVDSAVARLCTDALDSEYNSWAYAPCRRRPSAPQWTQAGDIYGVEWAPLAGSPQM